MGEYLNQEWNKSIFCQPQSKNKKKKKYFSRCIQTRNRKEKLVQIFVRKVGTNISKSEQKTFCVDTANPKARKRRRTNICQDVYKLATEKNKKKLLQICVRKVWTKISNSARKTCCAICAFWLIVKDTYICQLIDLIFKA